jgi:hypothetical protein
VIDIDLCLSYHPFEGDRDSDITVFSDRMIVARKAHRCQICGGPIAADERHRARTERDNDDQVVATFRFCGLCCEAMVKALYDPDDVGKAIEERTGMGIKAANDCPRLDEERA